MDGTERWLAACHWCNKAVAADRAAGGAAGSAGGGTHGAGADDAQPTNAGTGRAAADGGGGERAERPEGHAGARARLRRGSWEAGVDRWRFDRMEIQFSAP